MNPPTFTTGSYTDIAGHPASAKLWALLNSEQWKIKMKTASDLGRPALEAVSEELLIEFADQLKDDWPHRDRFKQMAGAMTRQVMEAEGYVFLRSNIPLSGAPFSRASKYRARDAFEFHIWRLSVDPRFVGITVEKNEYKLPSQDDGIWIFWKSVAGSLGDGKLHLSIAVGVTDVTAALSALRTNGVYVEKTSRIMRASQ